MIVVCTRCGSRNRIPDAAREGKAYRCGQCKAVLTSGAGRIEPGPRPRASILESPETATTRSLTLIMGVLLMCLAIAVLMVATGWMALDEASRHSRESLNVVMYPSDILRKVAEPVAGVGEEERQLAVLLQNTMARLKGQGLSAPQVGVSKRISVVNLGRSVFPRSSSEVVVMVNPEIVDRNGSVTAFEGCLSLPRGDWKIEVTRSERVTVRYMTLEGEESTLEEAGQNARIVQHEIDHLNGILIIDYATGPKITPSVLAAIVVYSVAVCGAVVIYVWNRRKGNVMR